MTPEQGYDRAKFEIPGSKIIMGPTEAVEKPIKPISWLQMGRLPGDPTLRIRDLRTRLGFVPSTWARSFADFAEIFHHHVTDDQWRWLHGSASKKDANAWLAQIAADHKAQKEGTDT